VPELEVGRVLEEGLWLMVGRVVGGLEMGVNHVGTRCIVSDWVDGLVSSDLTLEILVSPGGRTWQKRHFRFRGCA
jgi:hypothetical protein